MSSDHLARKEITLEEFLKQAPTQGGIYGRILRHHWEVIQKKPALSAALKQILMANESVNLEPIISHQLESMGLIQLDGDHAYISCKIYLIYFKNQYQQQENTL